MRKLNTNNKSIMLITLLLLITCKSGYKVNFIAIIKSTEELSARYFDQNILLAEKYAKEQLNLSLHIMDREEIAKAYYQLGRINMKKKDFYISLEFFLKALHLRKQTNNKLEIARISYSIAYLYDQIDLYEIALTYYKTSSELFQDNKDKLAIIYRNCGVNYSELQNYTQALYYYEKSLSLSKEVGIQENIIFLYDDIAIVKRNLGLYDDALTYYHKALAINQSDTKLFLYSYNNLGDIYKLKKEYQKSAYYLQKALEIVKSEKIDSNIQYTIYNNLGEIHLAQKEYSKALYYFKINETLHINPEDRELIFTYENIAQIYRILQNEAQAQLYQTKSENLEKLLDNRNNTFRKLHQTKLRAVDKSLEYFKTINVSLIPTYLCQLE